MHLTVIPTEMSSDCSSEEWTETQRVLMMELCLVLMKEMCLELLTETLKGTSLGWSSVELMAMEMVLMMESDWVEMTAMDLDQLME